MRAMPKKSSLISQALTNVVGQDDPDYGTFFIALLLVILGSAILAYGAQF